MVSDGTFDSIMVLGHNFLSQISSVEITNSETRNIRGDRATTTTKTQNPIPTYKALLCLISGCRKGVSKYGVSSATVVTQV